MGIAHVGAEAVNRSEADSNHAFRRWQEAVLQDSGNIVNVPMIF
jgi:hypothetical protein